MIAIPKLVPPYFLDTVPSSLLKWGEEMLLEFFTHANPAVLHLKGEPGPPILYRRLSPQAYDSACGCKFHCVREQIEQNLIDPQESPMTVSDTMPSNLHSNTLPFASAGVDQLERSPQTSGAA